MTDRQARVILVASLVSAACALVSAVILVYVMHL